MKTAASAAMVGMAVLVMGATAGADSNPFTGRQEREEVFEFAAKPEVVERAGKYVIRFAAKAACDATVAIVDRNGRIVRHLASGVLGKNAPSPFTQGSLAQETVWDGRDDAGKPVDPSQCRVRVALGLYARYGRALGWSRGKAGIRTGMAIDREGRLFVLDGAGGEACAGFSYNIKVFDREGRYLRQIAPPPAHVPPKVATIAWNSTAGGKLVPRITLGYHGITMTRNYWLSAKVMRQAPVVTRDGKLLFFTPCERHHRNRLLIAVDGRDGTIAPDGVVNIDKGGRLLGTGHMGHNGGPLHAALSPDEKWLYVASSEWADSVHGVFRMSMAAPGRPSLFAGTAGEAGKDNAHLNNPVGVACDRDGNVYVADSGNDRIQVFGPAGGHLKTLAVEHPCLLAVHSKTSEVYVLQLVARREMKLIKLGGLNDPAVEAKGPTLRCMYDCSTRMVRSPLIALDDTGSETYVWLKSQGNSIQRLRDAGEAFKAAPTGDVNAGAEGWQGWEPWAHQCQIAADPLREELYIREQGMCWAGAMIRVDGRTGRVLDRCGQAACGGSTPFGIEQVRVGPGGRVYYRSGHRGEWLTRYDPETKQLAPLPGSRPTGRKQGSLEYKGKPYRAIYIPANGNCRTFQDVMGIAPNGDLYVPCGIREEDIPLLKEAGLDFPTIEKLYSNPFHGSLLKVFTGEGRLKCLSALPGLGPSQGVCIGRRGEVYMALECQPIGAKLPDGMAPDAEVPGQSWATIVKFDSRFGKYPIGRINGRWTPEMKGKPTHTWMRGGFKRPGEGAGPVRIENVLWDYPGFGLFKGSSCMCPKSNMCMDGFERLFVPALHTCTVNVLDANGNVVVRIGGYGNADSRGKDSPVPDPKTGELRPRRPDDPPDLKSPLAEPEVAFACPNFTAVTDEALYVNDKANSRIVRAVLTYRAQETAQVP